MPDTQQPVRILHLEDSPRDAVMIADLLEAEGVHCTIGHAANRKQFEAALSVPDFDLILCDFNLADFDGLSALKLARETHPETPVIIVSGAIDSEEAVACLKAGATDYLLKQRLERLPTAVMRALDEAQEQRLRKQAEEELRSLNADLERRVRARTEELQAANTFLKVSEEKFRLIAENNADVIWLSDPEIKEVHYINPAYERIWGRTCESVYQSPKSFLEALHPEDRDRVMGELADHADGRWDTEFRIVRPDGTVRWIRDRGYPLRDERGRIQRMAGVAADITGIKQAALDLAEQSARLKAALDEAQQAKTLLLRNDKLASLGRMCAGLIHEINNPLNYAIQGILLLGLESESLPEATRENFLETLKDVEEGISRVVRIVSDLRGFTKVSDNNLQTFPLKPVVETTLRFFSHEFKDGAKIEVDVPETITIRGDPNHIAQVIVNIMQNALDAEYQPGVCPEIRISASCVDRGVILRIRDNGLGIPPQNLGNVFDPFFTTKDVGAGMGLGLAICHSIMADHGGSIEVHSEPGAFCEFVLIFPPAP